MAITAALVKTLRERTGAPMMACKKALVETDGDLEAAVEAMRKEGQAKADKKAGRVAAEGVILAETNADKTFGVLVEVNCETDFVGRDDNFLGFANLVLQTALRQQITEVNVLMAEVVDYDGLSMTLEEARKALIAKIGENITVRRVASLAADAVIGTYIHGGRIGVMVSMAAGEESLAKDLAMHVAASQPEVVSPDEMPAELVAKEREIFIAQAAESGKPADIIEKMVVGRVQKFLKEMSLLGQPFVKDPNTSVEALLQSQQAKVTQFVRFVLGEGIEKQVSNFAEEVMAQVQDS